MWVLVVKPRPVKITNCFCLLEFIAKNLYFLNQIMSSPLMLDRSTVFLMPLRLIDIVLADRAPNRLKHELRAPLLAVSDLFSKEPVNYSDCRILQLCQQTRVSYRLYRISVYMSTPLFDMNKRLELSVACICYTHTISKYKSKV